MNYGSWMIWGPMKNNSFVIHTDGACKGNPGQGGWGAVIEQDGNQTIISGGEPHTTNNRMEMTAVNKQLLEFQKNYFH